MTAEEIARRCAEVMSGNDMASRSLGLELLGVGPGRAEMGMTVTRSMLNGFGMCHGGFIFMLADATFAYASNTRDKVTVAQQCSIAYLAAAREGMRLKAVGVERGRSGRAGIYDVTVLDETGATIAEFRGLSRTIEGGILGNGEKNSG
jgi:acyl-CoA thioesterase